MNKNNKDNTNKKTKEKDQDELMDELYDQLDTIRSDTYRSCEHMTRHAFKLNFLSKYILKYYHHHQHYETKQRMNKSDGVFNEKESIIKSEKIKKYKSEIIKLLIKNQMLREHAGITKSSQFLDRVLYPHKEKEEEYVYQNLLYYIYIYLCTIYMIYML